MTNTPALLRLIADPARLELIEALRLGETAVNDLVPRVGIAQSGVSRHLRILHEAGVVRVRADGQRRLYALQPEPFAELDAWVSGYRALWSDRLDRFAGALTALQLEKETE